MPTIRSPRHTALFHAAVEQYCLAPRSLFLCACCCLPAAATARCPLPACAQLEDLLSPPSPSSPDKIISSHFRGRERERGREAHFLSWQWHRREGQRAGFLDVTSRAFLIKAGRESRPPRSSIGGGP